VAIMGVGGMQLNLVQIQQLRLILIQGYNKNNTFILTITKIARNKI
jgi:hypothetical protein